MSNIEPQKWKRKANVEYRMSNIEPQKCGGFFDIPRFAFRRSHFSFLPSTFDIRYSIFDILRFAFRRFA
ncbi:MAG: hypothetical protein COT06_11735, partial [Syntrophobacteraceae bacterium CG07_land_8_20_14_0_80_61_8]